MNDKNENDGVAAVLALIDKSGRAEDSGDAMRFSQAACNASNALCNVITTTKNKSMREFEATK